MVPYLISTLPELSVQLGVNPMPSGGSDGSPDGGLDGGPDGIIGYWPKPGSFTDRYGLAPKNGTHGYRTDGNVANPFANNSYPGNKVPFSGVPNQTTDSNFGYNSSTYSSRNPANIQYVGGGAVVSLPDGTLALIAHCERWRGVSGSLDSTYFYSTLAVLRSTDSTGTAWNWVGECISVATTKAALEAANAYSSDVGSGPIVQVGLYYHCYYTEKPTGAGNTYVAVARCLVSAFNSAILSGVAPTFVKLTTTGWDGVAYGCTVTCGVGKPLPSIASSDNPSGNLQGSFCDVIFHEDSRQYVMSGFAYSAVSPSGSGGGNTFCNVQILVATSQDGINWGPQNAATTLAETAQYNSSLGYSTSGEGAIYSSLWPQRQVIARSGSGQIKLWYTINQRFGSQCVYRRRTLQFVSPAFNRSHASRWRSGPTPSVGGY